MKLPKGHFWIPKLPPEGIPKTATRPTVSHTENDSSTYIYRRLLSTCSYYVYLVDVEELQASQNKSLAVFLCCEIIRVLLYPNNPLASKRVAHELKRH